MNAIDVAADEPYDASDFARWMPRLGARVLEVEGLKQSSLSVLVTSDDVVQGLNRDFRGYDEPTDVLSFGLSELAKPAVDDAASSDGFILPPGAPLQLGEVVIAYPTAARQAAAHGRSVEHELAHLLIHGILHLLGYDHYDPEEERAMRAREDLTLAERLWERAGG